MTDELAVTGIECFAHHGVFDFERREGQAFVIDLALGIDTRPAAASDDDEPPALPAPPPPEPAPSLLAEPASLLFSPALSAALSAPPRGAAPSVPPDFLA